MLTAYALERGVRMPMVLQGLLGMGTEAAAVEQRMAPFELEVAMMERKGHGHLELRPEMAKVWPVQLSKLVLTWFLSRIQKIKGSASMETKKHVIRNAMCNL